MPDPQQVEELIDLGATGIVIFALIGGFFGWWIYGPIHRSIVRELTKDRDYWRTIALRGLGVAAKALGDDDQDA